MVAPACSTCDTLLDRPTAGPVCEACWSAVAHFTPPICGACGDPLPAGHLAASSAASATAALSEDAAWVSDACARCRHAPSLVARSRAIGDYAGTLRAIIHALKYDKRCSIAPRLSALMRACGGDVVRGVDAAVPVPLHWKRKWQRGFNQAALLASGLGVAVWPALQRLRATSPQVDLPAEARRVNVKNAFAIARRRWPWQVSWRARLKGRVVLLVDDVSTTASTLEACAKVLLEAGVREVRALTAARVVGPPKGERTTQRSASSRRTASATSCATASGGCSPRTRTQPGPRAWR